MTNIQSTKLGHYLTLLSVDRATECWLWKAAIKSNGYGAFCIRTDGKAKLYRAHRWSYEYFKGSIPKGLDVDHICRVRNCVNPNHLRAVTRSVNLTAAGSLVGKYDRKKMKNVCKPISGRR